MASKQGKYAGVPTDQPVVVGAPVEESGADSKIAKAEPFQIGSIDDNEEHHENEFVNDEGGKVYGGIVGGGAASNETWTKGSVQSPAYRDVWFAIVFVAQFLVVVALAIAFGSEAQSFMKKQAIDQSRRMGRALYYAGDSLGRGLKKHKHDDTETPAVEEEQEDEKMDDDSERFEDLYNDDTTNNEETASAFASNNQNFNNGDDVQPPPEAFFPFVIIASVIAAPILAVVALGYMSRNAAQLIRASLYIAVGLNVIFFFFALLAGVPLSAIIHAIFAALLACYAKAVWHRIPYAAANLRSAIVAVKANMGVSLVAFSSIPASVIWLFTWVFSFGGTLTRDFMYTTREVQTTSQWDSENSSGTHMETTISGAGIVVIFAFILSLHWTHQVINGVVRATIAGVIGTWWFSPLEASSFCSSAVRDSLARSLTYSFGSICFGSLIVAIVETLRAWLRGAASRNRNGIVRLIAQCLLLWVERIVEYFNKWAFVYVGLYGYSYLEAGKSVMTLFRDRGWTAIISDNLVNRVLALACLAIGLIVALVSVIAGLLTGVTGGWLGWLAVAAWIGFFVGFILSGIMMGVLSGSVDSIIVCYAEAPMKFKENHPHLHREMEDTWTAAWPDVTLTPVAMAVPLGGPNARDAPLN